MLPRLTLHDLCFSILTQVTVCFRFYENEHEWTRWYMEMNLRRSLFHVIWYELVTGPQISTQMSI